MKKNVLIINGPNLNLLGKREPNIYGSTTLNEVKEKCQDKASSYNTEVVFFQSNKEGEIIDVIQDAPNKYNGIIINPGAYSHTSIAIMDALKVVKMPIIEVHISNIFKREEFRRHSYVSLVADGVICGLGTAGYELALDAIIKIINQHGDKF
ncbi:MAG: type II 3-dehydroquinate dehydratase [Alphaproteobacteria bacterium]